MKIFVAGATGAVGKRLLPLLVECGFEVVGMTRSPEKELTVRNLGAEPAVADGLDRTAVMAAVMRAEPDVVIHEMTGLTGMTSLRNFDTAFALTNRLRSEGTDHLLEAAQAAGARRFIAQSFGNWNFERTGSAPKTEDDPLDPDPPAKQRKSMAAIKHLESAVTDAGGLALRYGILYGPGNGISEDGEMAEMVRKRRFPIIGDGGGVWSFIHVDDAATATIAALDRGMPGIYNVADDEPVAVRDWLPELARALDAPPPRRVPVWLGRLASGDVGVSLMTSIRGASNEKAKRELGWRPRFPSYREGFRDGLGYPSRVAARA
jgi:nucleoside-diphosphate-sugar epimerase